MEVVTATPASSAGVPPFHDHDVREWSRIDSLTGVLERARLETDRWAANTNNSSHKYGKVVDSRARSGADGALQQQARRQLEVFQSQIPGGHLQVIKTHTVSSSRWTNKTTTSTPSDSVFENLQLSLNPLDLSSQKSKATVGRSVSRRPPSRQRLRDEPSSNSTNPLTNNVHLTAATNLHRVSRLCHQIHDSAVKQAFGRRSPRPPIHERQNGDGSCADVFDCESIRDSIEESTTKVNGHTNLLRTKSTSSEDIHLLTPEKDATTKSIEDLEDLEQLQNWRRTSKIRRSLQFPKQQSPTSTKPIDLPENSVSVRKIREDLEKGRRLSTALRGNTVDLQALDQILQTISSSSSVLSDKTADENLEDSENEQLITTSKKQKRNSFVTVESLQEVRGRLRRTSSPTINLYSKEKDKDVDDGIVTEDTNSNLIDMPEKSNPQSRVRSYVYGMEAMLNKKNIGTNSLESRTKLVNGNSTNRSEDWYNRRKSYGFEQVHGHQEPTNSLKDKSLVESSTDSGICKSTEIVLLPPAIKANGNYNNYSSEDSSDSERERSNGIAQGNVKKIATIFAQDESNNAGFFESGVKKFSFREPEWKRPLKSTTITIPITKNNNNIVDLSWNDEPVKEVKRHSIAVDESKYVLNSDENKYRRTSLAINDNFRNSYSQENDDAQNKKTKKVEFCKTEVHFAADSGKVNIVETDEKPPPTHNFRRRRRNSGPLNEFNKNGLPMLHFGDTSYEKSMFGINDEETTDEIKQEDPVINNGASYENVQPKALSAFGIVTVNTNTISTLHNSMMIDNQEEDRKDPLDIENIKGILKNKPIKPKPYHLGEQTLLNDVNNSDEDMNKWGVRLRHVSKEDTPIWKSTVTVHNMYNKSNNDMKGYASSTDDDQPEFQKLLRNLRPTRKLDIVSDSEHRYSDSFSNIRVLSPVKDNRRSSWSVSDKVKYTDDTQNGEYRGYSTKVNFGNGEATVIENDNYFDKDIRHPTWPRTENSLAKEKSEDRLNIAEENNIKTDKYLTQSKFSPVVLRKTTAPSTAVTNRTEFKVADKLSSPFLVGQNLTTNNNNTEIVARNGPISPAKEFKNVTDTKLQIKHTSDIVLRQPKKSEMTYFGVKVSPKPLRKVNQAVNHKENGLTEKPDLLQHHNSKLTSSPKLNSRIKPRKKSPVSDKAPIYENLQPTVNKYKSKEFDSSILDELTKAADQIMQAVNGYTDEDSHQRFTSEDEESKLKKPLTTISETKSWKHGKVESEVKKTKQFSTRAKLKHTSSNSSLESFSKEKRTPPSENRVNATKTVANAKKKPNELVKATTKARRLQRASSREALLQSHGSSSEDLSINIETPVRKMRLVKKTKVSQLSMTNGLEISKKTPVTSTPIRKKKEETSVIPVKTDERISGVLPEIRHKTAISTIRSTAEKNSRERAKQKIEEARKKAAQKRESASRSVNSVRSEKNRSAVTNKETVTHRISTANIKKCHRADSGGQKH